MTVSTDLFRDTWLFQDGKAEGFQDSLRAMLEAKFPGAKAIPEIDLIEDSAALTGLIAKVLNAVSFESARETIVAAAKPSRPRHS